MSGGGGEEKSEKPTPQRLKKARKDGQTPKTMELGAWAGIGAASLVLPWSVRTSLDALGVLMVQSGQVISDPHVTGARALLTSAGSIVVKGVLPLSLTMLCIGVLASAAQGGVYFSTKAIKPTFSKLNPWHGVKRMFGTQGLWEAAKALIKTAALAAAMWQATSAAQVLLSSSGALPLSTVLDAVAGSAVMMLRIAALTGLVLAGLDYAVVRKKTMKKLKMTKSEIKQEHKQSDGDPHTKAAVMAAGRAMAQNQMMQDIPDADAVLANPTHVAVAIKYDVSKGAPRVVAKGRDEIAAKIREIAAENRVPIVQDIPLARALHSSCEIGQAIPPQLFTAVARVLAFVMQLKKRGAHAGFHRPHFPAPDVAGLPRAGQRR